jgi:hypothetical protein
MKFDTHLLEDSLRLLTFLVVYIYVLIVVPQRLLLNKLKAVTCDSVEAIAPHSGHSKSTLIFVFGKDLIGTQNKSIKPTFIKLSPRALTSSGNVIIKVSYHIPTR